MKSSIRRGIGAFVTAISAFLVTGCASFDNPYGVNHFDKAALKDGRVGALLLSTGAPSRCISFATSMWIYGMDDDTKLLGMVSVDSYVHESDFDDHHGTLNIAVLRPGKYEFRPKMSNEFLKAFFIPTFTFEIKAGEVLYGGELFMQMSCGRQLLFTVSDQFDRDMALAVKQNPQMAGMRVEKRLLAKGRVIDLRSVK